MKGSYRKQGENSYEIRISLGKNPATGKYDQYRETFHGDEEACKKYLAELVYQFEHGNKPKQSNVSFGEFLDIYEEKFIEEQLKPSTKRQYKMTIKRYIKPNPIVNRKIRDLTAFHVDQFYAELRRKVSLNIVKDVHTVMCSALRQAYIWDYIPNKFKIDKVEPIPAKDRQIMKKRAKQKRQVWSAGKVYKFLMWMRGRGLRRYFIYLIAATVGLRRGENLALRWDESIDFKNRKIRIVGSITENKYEEYVKEDYRTIYLFDMLYNELSLYKKIQDEELKDKAYISEGWVHSNQAGKLLMRPDSVTHKFKEDIELFNSERIVSGKSELPIITLHDLRHTCATLLFKYFHVPLEIISEILGHKSGVDFTRQTYIDDEDISEQTTAFTGFNELFVINDEFVDTIKGRNMCSECEMSEDRPNESGKLNVFCLKYNNWSKAVARSCEGAVKRA